MDSWSTSADEGISSICGSSTIATDSIISEGSWFTTLSKNSSASLGSSIALMGSWSISADEGTSSICGSSIIATGSIISEGSWFTTFSNIFTTSWVDAISMDDF